MKFKNYPREYEYVFTGEDLIKRKCDLSQVGVHGDFPESEQKYCSLLKETFGSLEKHVYDHYVKLAWLFRKFCYMGRRRIKYRGNGVRLDRAFGVYLRYFVGFDNRFFIGHYVPFTKIVGYFDDLYPNFDDNNPFEQKYEFPFKYLNMECMFLVYQLPERLDLLRYGDSKGMTYTEFLDYVLNYVNCYNEEHGEKYLFIFSYTAMPYIKKI